jgi:hypothetical protein
MAGTNLWIQPEELGVYANTEYAYEACKSASYLLWTMSGRKYTGEVTVTERYVCAKRAYRMGPSSKNYYATLIAGEVYNIPITDFQEYAELVSDGLSPESRIKLRGRPVTKIHTVRTRDGRILDPGSYYLVDHSTLQASAGVPWTPCNVEVTYTYGSTVPTAGKMAARTLAIEFAKLWSGDDECMLPQRVTSVARQGVSYTLLDSQDFIDDMRTGVYAIDLFLKSVNPDKARAKSRVFSPDVPRARRYTPKGPVLPVNVNFDIAVVKKTPASWTSVGKTGADVTLFFDEPGWTPVVTVRNTSASKAMDIASSGIVVNPTNESVSFNISYDDAYKTLGTVDPGTWTLYASKTVAGVTTLAEIETGNLQIKLYD